ncbi:hypothetical protein L1987_06653 [Smallanthus sonchifolius]|uniref:Uncharacterized protein n=1 Tax=Smallanthus sonchifolius TaxID=185202 RepID=A0ACB9JYR1_9ASTR|nr:hypothetical protein L1987_06653 [Smallanthus sonchifolius]
MGYLGTMDYSSYKKIWVLDQWRYFAHVMIMCLSTRKARKDAMRYDLAAAMVALSLNKGYNFSKYIYKSITNQISAADRFRFLLYLRFMQLLINDVVPNLPTIGERLQVKRVDKRVFAQFLKTGSVEPTPKHTPLFGHLINEAYHSDEQQEEEEVGSEDDMSEDEGDEEQVVGGGEDSDSESTESDLSDSDDAPSQAHPRRLTKVILLESSSKRKRQATSSEYELDSDSGAAIQRRRRESINKQRVDSRNKLSFEAPVIVSLHVPSVQVVMTTPILTESVTITPSTTVATTIQSTIPTTTIEPISQPYNFGDFSQGFDFDTIFSSPLHNVEASTYRNPDPSDARIDTLETQVVGLLETVQKSKEESEAQQAQINSLVDEVTILRSQRTGTEERLINEGGDASGGNKGNSVADILKDVSNEVSDNAFLFLEPDYSKEAQIEALCNLEEIEIDSCDDWDEEDDVVIEVPKGDVEGEYEFEDGEIFEVPSFESHLHTGSVEPASTIEASTKASPAPVDPEAHKDKHMPSSSSKDPAPVRQKTSIIDKHGATGMILTVKFDEDKKLFAIKRAWGGVQYLKPTSEAFNSMPRYDLVNLVNRELLGHSNNAVAMGLW